MADELFLPSMNRDEKLTSEEFSRLARTFLGRVLGARHGPEGETWKRSNAADVPNAFIAKASIAA